MMMAAVGHCYGHTIIYVDDKWVWFDTLEEINDKTISSHPCPKCGKPPTPEGYDACLGYINGAISACCGHGVENPYIIMENDNA
jgi:hypothetical protein